MPFPVPLRILHNAEEHPQFPGVLRSPIPNAFEVDCWVYDGKVWVHHDCRLAKTPILYRSSGFRRFRLRFQFPLLEDFFLNTHPAAVIKIDVKYRPRQNPNDIAAALQRFFLNRKPWQNRCYFCVAVQHISIAKALKKAMPSIPLFLTVKKSDDICMVSILLARGLQIGGICVSHKLILTQQSRIKQLIEKGLWVDVWAVNDSFAAQELIQNGVQAVTSDSLDVLDALQ